jgi:hypothetical protein
MHLLTQLTTALMRFQATDDTLRDITGAEIIIPPPTTDALPWLLWSALAAAFILAVAVVVRMRTRFRPARRSPVAPIRRSLTHLDRLDRLQLRSKGRNERHFTILAGILRRYIARRHGIAARRMTSSELLAVVASDSPIMDSDFLKRFIAECDIAKFAPPAALNGHGSHLDAELREWLLRQKASNPAAPLDAVNHPSKMSDS